MDDHEPDEPGITPARATGTDLSTVRPEVAELLTALEAVADAAVAVARSDGGVDGREAAVVAAGIAAATSRLRVVQARMLAVVEADGIWSVESRSLVRWAA
ncbi:hypothetical protein, partial [Cellulomonas aerilata]